MAEVERTVEDRLREEYFSLLPEMHRVADRLETEIRYLLLPVSGRLQRYERLAVKSRVKSCESALDKLRRHQETRDFKDRPQEAYMLTSLNDLAGVRVLAFPRHWLADVDRRLRSEFPTWTPDPVKDGGELQTFKYHGYCPQASERVRGEYQVVSMLTGLLGKWSIPQSTRATLLRRSGHLRSTSRCRPARTNWRGFLFSPGLLQLKPGAPATASSALASQAYDDLMYHL